MISDGHTVPNNLVETVIYAWNKFWFDRRDPLPLAIYRVLLGICIMQINVAQYLPNFFYFFGRKAIVSEDVLCTYFWITPETFAPFVGMHGAEEWKIFLFVVVILANIGVIFGCFTRLSCVILYLGLFGLFNDNPYIVNGGDEFRRLMILFLCFAPAGETFSIDSIIAGLKNDWRKTGFAPAPQPIWALRLLQLQLSFIYWNVFKNKIDGSEWRDGTAVYYATHVQDLQRIHFPYIFENDLTVRFLTYGTILIEGALALFVWIKPLCYPVLLVGILFHEGIDLAMELPGFESAFIATYILFVTPQDLYKFAGWCRKLLHPNSGNSLVCCFNGHSFYSVQLAGIVRRLDIFRTIELRESIENAQNSVSILSENVTLSGFSAFSLLCTRLPLLYFLVPFNFLFRLLRVENALFSFCAKCLERFLQRLTSGYHGFKNLADNDFRQKCFLCFVFTLFVGGILTGQSERPAMMQLVKKSDPGKLTKLENHALIESTDKFKNVSEQDLQKILWDLRGASVAHRQRDFPLAEARYLLAIKNIELALQSKEFLKKELYEKALLDTANLYLDADQPEKSIVCYRLVQKFDQRNFGTDAAKTARDLNSLGVAMYLKGLENNNEQNRLRDFHLADSFVRQALATDSNGIDKANFLDNLALICRDQGFFAESKRLKMESLNLTRQISGRIIPP